MRRKMIATLVAACLLCAWLPLFALSEDADPVPFGPFEAEDLLNDESVTEAVFADAEITLVNFWATWCGPCIQELPDLAKLSEMTDGRVQVISVLLDSVDREGNRDEASIDAMRLLAEEAGVAYAVLMPDEFLSMVSTLVEYIPTTFIIDRDGVLQETFVGSQTAEEWLAIAQNVADTVYEEDITLAK